MTSIVQHNCQKTEHLTEKTWGRGYVVLLKSTKLRFVEDVNTDKDFLYPFLNFVRVFKNLTPEKIAHI